MNHLQNFSTGINKINSKGLGEIINKEFGSLVEVPFSLPGEEVNFGLDSCGKVSFLSHKKTSPHRVELKCQQFKKCGGCSLPHASQKFVTSWKGTITAGHLEQRGLYAKFRSTFVTPERSRRRAAFSGR